MDPHDPRHGTNAGYAYLGCRETCCRKAHTLQMNLWRMGKSDHLIDSTGALRRIEALMCLGYDRSTLSRMLGHQRDYLGKLRDHARISGRVWTKVAELYDELCMTPAPDSPITRRTIAYARRRRLVPPLAWNDIDTDDAPTGVAAIDPNHIDPVVVQRILGGDWHLPCTPAEKTAVCETWTTRGGSLNDLSRLTGWRTARYWKAAA